MAFQVARSLDEWRAGLGALGSATVITIGNFDGVHIGHERILRRVVERACDSSAIPTVLTFDPHPSRVLRPADAPPLITTLPQRLERFRDMGLAAAVVLKFDGALSQLSPQQFVERILIHGLRVAAVLIGPNFRFGHQQAGNSARLRQFGKRYGFKVEVVPAVVLPGQVVSSTTIRQAVREGRVELARRMLGRPFSLRGQIRPGTGQGRKLVVPTLNLLPETELLPKKGVYATETSVGSKLYRSATNVGLRPTFDGQNLTIESHLFDFSETLREGPMEIHFWKRLRDEKRFSNPAELRAQIDRDLERAQRFFARLQPSPALTRAR